MNRLLALALGLAALTALSPPAEARDGCGRGYYFDGYGCRPQGYSGRHYAAPPQVYGYERPRYYAQPRYYGPPRPSMGANGTISCNNPNYTWQNGACRPYTGPR